MDSLRINSQGGHFAALEKLRTHDPIFYIQGMNGQGARPASSQKDPKRPFSVQQGVQLPYPPITLIINA
jgi:hypothetical protein